MRRIAALALATVVACAATLAPTTAGATNKHDERDRDHGRFEPPKPVKVKPLDINALPNAPFELSGRVASVDAAARTLVVQVQHTNLPGLSGTNVKVGVGSPSFILRNREPAGFGDIMFNDQLFAHGVKDPTSGTPVAYIIHTEGVRSTVPTTTPAPVAVRPPVTATVPAPVVAPVPPPITTTITSTVSAANVAHSSSARLVAAAPQADAARKAAKKAAKAAKRAAKRASRR